MVCRLLIRSSHPRRWVYTPLPNSVTVELLQVNHVLNRLKSLLDVATRDETWSIGKEALQVGACELV